MHFSQSTLFTCHLAKATIAHLAPPEKFHQAKNILLKIYILIGAVLKGWQTPQSFVGDWRWRPQEASSGKSALLLPDVRVASFKMNGKRGSHLLCHITHR